MVAYTIVRCIDDIISCRMYSQYKDVLTTAKKWTNPEIENYKIDCWKVFQLTNWNETVEITPQIKHDINTNK